MYFICVILCYISCTIKSVYDVLLINMNHVTAVLLKKFDTLLTFASFYQG